MVRTCVDFLLRSAIFYFKSFLRCFYLWSLQRRISWLRGDLNLEIPSRLPSYEVFIRFGSRSSFVPFYLLSDFSVLSAVPASIERCLF